jgi:hypothetical protein
MKKLYEASAPNTITIAASDLDWKCKLATQCPPMKDLEKIEEAFRQSHASSVVSMAQIMALTELVEELAMRVGVTSIHGLSIKDGLSQRTDELSRRLLQGLVRPHPAVAAILDEVSRPPSEP